MIRLAYTPLETEPQLGVFDAQLYQGDVDTRLSLETAIFISIFTDARAAADDRLPDTDTTAYLSGRRGWWGDSFATVANTIVGGDPIGSKLWLLSREKQTEQTLVRAKGYVADALQWLISDGVAAQVNIQTEWLAMGILGIGVTLTRPDGPVENFRFSYAWDELLPSNVLTKSQADAMEPLNELLSENDGLLTTESGEPLLT